ncbi:MAG: class I mannose-6-phosphate isomerase [Bacteroidales bacterium]|nr:class I mannose-6-phosphate isomerase [Bacteroidales bacterium]
MLYPLKFKPIFKDKIWGGCKMKTALHKDFSPLGNCGESWELSTMPGNVSEVTNGYLAGNGLDELVEIYMGDLVGEGVFDSYGNEFPLLVKWIDAADDLSVQVHPDDKLARKLGFPRGKTELWHVVDADEGAGLYVGFKEGVDMEMYTEAVKAGTVERLLNFYPVKKGDTFFIPAGTVHSIGKGVLLCEIQQSSDITYRIFDWNRKDSNGKSRELHTELANEALRFDKQDNCKLQVTQKLNESAPLLRSSFFNINILEFDHPMEKVYAAIDSFVIYVCLEGKVHCVYEGEYETITQGEVILKPADLTEMTLVPEKKSKILETFI